MNRLVILFFYGLFFLEGILASDSIKPKWSPGAQAYLSVAELQKVKQQPCTYLHLWATWCTVCVQEMPELIKILNRQKQIHPVIVDVSKEFSQKNFSRKFMAGLKPAFTVYFKPKGKDADYIKGVDAAWTGGLPYSILYHKGKKIKEWQGASNLKTLAKALKSLAFCKSGKSQS